MAAVDAGPNPEELSQDLARQHDCFQSCCQKFGQVAASRDIDLISANDIVCGSVRVQGHVIISTVILTLVVPVFTCVILMATAKVIISMPIVSKQSIFIMLVCFGLLLFYLLVLPFIPSSTCDQNFTMMSSKSRRQMQMSAAPSKGHCLTSRRAMQMKYVYCPSPLD